MNPSPAGGPSATPITVTRTDTPPVTISGTQLSIAELLRVARGGATVALTRDDTIVQRVHASRDFVTRTVDEGRPLYGVTTAFGGMSNIAVPSGDAALLQRSAVYAHKAGLGEPLPAECVRAAMVLRANSHLHGASGVRLELIERLVACVNAGVTPIVPELGSIGASGDLVPLAYVAGAVIGLDPAFLVECDGERLPAPAALARIGLPALTLQPKEALAMMNGTSMSTAIAACAAHDARELIGVAFGVHALAIQALRGGLQAFDPFVHEHKAHAGQRRAADVMRRLLAGSAFTIDETPGHYGERRGALLQDRYSIRCLPQFLGPVIDQLAAGRRHIEVEMNAATDNPLIDGAAGLSYHSGNFLGQYIGMAMDQMRHALGLCLTHVDTQIALLMAPEFSNGLPPSLVGNVARPGNVGMKSLQIVGNSIVPLLAFYGAPLIDRFPTHAEQFNQNINSQSFNAANLARRSVTLARQYLSLSLLIGVQAADLSAHLLTGTFDARPSLSPRTRTLYDIVRDLVGCPPSSARPYLWNDDEQAFDAHVGAIASDLASGGRITAALGDLLPLLEADA